MRTTLEGRHPQSAGHGGVHPRGTSQTHPRHQWNSKSSCHGSLMRGPLRWDTGAWGAWTRPRRPGASRRTLRTC